MRVPVEVLVVVCLVVGIAPAITVAPVLHAAAVVDPGRRRTAGIQPGDLARLQPAADDEHRRRCWRHRAVLRLRRADQPACRGRAAAIGRSMFHSSWTRLLRLRPPRSRRPGQRQPAAPADGAGGGGDHRRPLAPFVASAGVAELAIAAPHAAARLALWLVMIGLRDRAPVRCTGSACWRCWCSGGVGPDGVAHLRISPRPTWR